MTRGAARAAQSDVWRPLIGGLSSVARAKRRLARAPPIEARVKRRCAVSAAGCGLSGAARARRRGAG